MISAAENQRLTRVGAETPAGALLRRYWQPAALVEELSEKRPVVPLRLLGEDLVLFRSRGGKLGLLGRHCPHRGADLAFGRLEPAGLRCAFHGWLFAPDGQCLETPAEPEGSPLAASVCQKSYPVLVRNGIVFAYLGSGAPPALPDFDCFIAPDAYAFAFKGLWECNWLQALEIGIDPAHASFLHRFLEDADPDEGYGQQFRGRSTDSEAPMTKILREYDRPRIDWEKTEFGFRLITRREIGAAETHVRVTNLVFPNLIVLPLSTEITISQWHVPIDDHSCYWYAIFTSFVAPLDKAEMRRQRLELYTLPDYRARKNRANNYGYDPAEQESKTYTGMGFDINVHDQWAVESQGAIHDRTRETLGVSDRCIVAYRRLLLAAMQQNAAGLSPPMVLDRAAAARLTGPATLDGIAPAASWASYWPAADERRRRLAPWAPGRAAE